MSHELSAAQPAWKWEADGPVMEYNEELGTYCGAAAHSNRDDAFFSGERHYVGGVHCGYKWQCVEYARRYLLVRKGLVFADCGRASEIFPRLTVLTNVVTGDQLPWEAVPNGGPRLPEIGSVIIYPFDQEKLPWGHVGVISFIHLFGEDEPKLPGRDGTGEIVGFVGIAEQNILALSWNGKPYGRCVPIVRRSNTDSNGSTGPFLYTLEEHSPHFLDCLGWKPLPVDVPDRDVTAPLMAKGAFREQETPIRLTRVPIGDFDPQLLTVEDQTSKAFQLFREHHPRKGDRGLHWPAVCFPQGGEAFVGGVHKAMRTVAAGMRHLLSTQPDDAIARMFDLPPSVVGSIRRSFAEEHHNQWLARVDLSFNGGTRAVVQELAFDSLEYFIDCSFQDRVSTETGNGKGFSPSSIRNDLRRSIPQLLKKAAARFNTTQGPITTFYFLDTSGDDQFERAQSLFIFEEASQAFAAENPHGISLKWVDAHSLRIEDGVAVDSTGAAVRCGWKTTPWQKLIRRASHSDQARVALEVLLTGTIQVHQPLWCAVAGSPTFLGLLRQWVAAKILRAGTTHKSLEELDAEEDDAAVILGEEPGLNPGFGPYRAVYQNSENANQADAPFSITSMFSVEGFFSASMLRESDPLNAPAAGCITPPDCYRPAAFRFYFPVNDGEE